MEGSLEGGADEIQCAVTHRGAVLGIAPTGRQRWTRRTRVRRQLQHIYPDPLPAVPTVSPTPSSSGLALSIAAQSHQKDGGARRGRVGCVLGTLRRTECMARLLTAECSGGDGGEEKRAYLNDGRADVRVLASAIDCGDGGAGVDIAMAAHVFALASNGGPKLLLGFGNLAFQLPVLHPGFLHLQKTDSTVKLGYKLACLWAPLRALKSLSLTSVRSKCPLQGLSVAEHVQFEGGIPVYRGVEGTGERCTFESWS